MAHRIGNSPDAYCPGCGSMGNDECAKDCERMKEFRQPYIYTLPEQFIEDKSVPMRWKLYAIINGFWISRLTAYASNRYFADKLKCTARHVQNCLEDLESLGVLTRVETSTGRILLPGGTNPAFVGGRTASSHRDEPSVHPISVSISENKIPSELEDEIRVVETSEEEKKPKSPAKYPNSKKVFSLWGNYPKHWDRNTTQLQAAEDIFDEIGIEEVKYVIDVFYPKHKSDKFCPKFNTPQEFLEKYPKLETYSEQNV